MIGGGIIFFLIQKQSKSLTAKPTSAPPANKNEEIPPEQPTNNPFSPPPAPNNNYSTKTLARVIKDDLQDALTNESRLKNYFLVYQLFEDGDITIYTKENEKLNEELKENFNHHYQQRKEKWDKDKKEFIKKHGWFQEQYDREFSWPDREASNIWKSDLEPQDHLEIADLICRIRNSKVEKETLSFKKALEKINDNPKLFYGSFEIYKSDAKLGRHFYFLGKEKEKFYQLFVPENHPTLALFPKFSYLNYQRLCYIEGTKNIPLEKNSLEYAGNEYNKYHKLVGLNNKIIIALNNF